MAVAINTLGGLALYRDGNEVRLPASKRTRALLAYLAITARPHRRDSLCEAFWESPNDPKGSLRWSLSKLRPLVNTPECERLQADRERVVLEAGDIAIDTRILADELRAPTLCVSRLCDIAARLNAPFLEGLELPEQDIYQRWLNGERREQERRLTQVCSRLAQHPDNALDEQLLWAQRWQELAPLCPSAATVLVTLLDRMGLTAELDRTARELDHRFRRAAISWSAAARAQTEAGPPSDEKGFTGRELLARQKIHFCRARDGARIAYASVGEGPTIIKAANWLTHLEHDWDAPIWSPLFRDLASDHRFIRYDERGNGLSDWNVGEISFESFVTDLETVVDACGEQRFSLLGISQGAAVSIEYAVRYPERVKHLILFGGYAAGWRVGASEAVTREREAVMTLTATGWGQDNPAYRQIFSSTFMPSANAEEFAWFNEFQRRTTSPENAVRFLSVFSDIDVRARLAQVQVPTLVIHSLGDQRIPVHIGRELAASIPGAEFVGLDSNGHLLLGREAASRDFVRAVREFIAHH
ncbi:alpha/beta hydrolase [Microbulbifer sp. HZ11]|uniref:alpha/beta hydrolase n=1 Tax=unclassified Microbulbifer TaxID=2619833 RepID=UPI000B2AE433|nr:alpha/beta hydrolase [Microbulbifer sp. HZ11]